MTEAVASAGLEGLPAPRPSPSMSARKSAAPTTASLTADMIPERYAMLPETVRQLDRQLYNVVIGCIQGDYKPCVGHADPLLLSNPVP